MNREILRLAVPNIISNITIPLLGLVDITLMGHSGAIENIGAVAFGGLIFSYLYWGFAFLRMGTVGITSQAFGLKSNKNASLTLYRGLIVSIIGGVTLILLKSPIELISFKLLNGSDQVESIARQYFNIRIYAAPATISIYVFSGWFLGMQNAIIPMILAIISNIANIIFNYLFVVRFNMGAEGVALGTLIAQYIGLFTAIFFCFKKFRPFLVTTDLKALFKWNEITHFFQVNKDIFIRTLCVITVLAFVQSKSAEEGDAKLAVSSILIQFLLFFSFFIDGFAHASESLTGRFMGERNRYKLTQSIRKSFIWGIFTTMAFTLLYLFGDQILFSLITDIKLVKEQLNAYKVWFVFIPLFSFLAFILDGIYIGATATAYMRNIMLISTVMIFFPVYFIFKSFGEINALWIGLLTFFLTRGLLQWIYLKRAVIHKI